MIRIHTSKGLWLCSFLITFFSLTTFGQDNELSFLFVGDVMQHDGQIKAAYNKTTNSYEYEDGFKYVKPIIHEYDIRVVNLEVTLAGKPYKGYPQFSAPDALPETLINAGFNLILTANNHSCDRGAKGVERTLDVLDKLGVQHTGTFRNQEERDTNYPLIIEEKGMKVAVLNYTYGTNGLFVAKPLIVNYIDSAVIRKDVAKAKTMNADYIICTMHWGTEYKLLPNKKQKFYEQFCYDLGVDMVIGGHPHVLQPIEKKEVHGEEKLTVWSLGNFVSNMSVRHTRGGVMVGASIKKENNKVVLGEVEHCLVYVHPRQEGAIKPYYILPEFDYNAYRPGFLSPAEITKMNQFFSDSRALFSEHNIGNTEKLITAQSNTGQLYQKYLGAYYSVLIPGGDDDLLMDKDLGPYLHETVDNEGESYILSGVCDTIEEARGNLQFIKDCKLSDTPKLVLVKPSGIIIIEE